MKTKRYTPSLTIEQLNTLLIALRDLESKTKWYNGIDSSLYIQTNKLIKRFFKLKYIKLITGD